ncbi:MAG: GNAT family N-acetyltransferase, partial [Xanthomarina sp.]
YLNRRGGLRAQIESVVIRKDKRGLGLGKNMFEWAINRAKEKDAFMVQLTSDKQRPRAIKFYENLGFTASHEGLKLQF